MKKYSIITLSSIFLSTFFGFNTVRAQVLSNEIHYDNIGADLNEKIEVIGVAGTNLSGWSIVLYNGADGLPYHTIALSGTIPNQCTVSGQNLGTLTFGPNLAVTGIQNGSPDGWALVNSSNTVIEFLSYEGTITALGGPANGTTSVDIVAVEDATGTVNGSIQRQSNNTWVTDPNINTMGACNTSQLALPIELKQFTLTQTDGSALLTWITASERNNDYFIVERSANGQAFLPIGEVNSAGNSTVEKTYTFRDDQPFTGANYYRLKQVDEDGGFGYSPMRVIRFGKVSQVEVYPNPAVQGLVNISFNAEKDGELNIDIIDGLGRVCSKQQMEVNKGINLIPVPVGQLSGGTYWLKMVNENTSFVHPITVR